MAVNDVPRIWQSQNWGEKTERELPGNSGGRYLGATQLGVGIAIRPLHLA